MNLRHKLYALTLLVTLPLASNVLADEVDRETPNKTLSNQEQVKSPGSYVSEQARRNKDLSPEERRANAHSLRDVARENSPGYQKALERRNENAEAKAQRQVANDATPQAKPRKFKRRHNAQTGRAATPAKARNKANKSRGRGRRG